MVVVRAEWGREELYPEYKLLIIRRINSKYLVYNIVTIVNVIVYLRVAESCHREEVNVR